MIILHERREQGIRRKARQEVGESTAGPVMQTKERERERERERTNSCVWAKEEKGLRLLVGKGCNDSDMHTQTAA